MSGYGSRNLGTVDAMRFAMVPSNEVPRSRFTTRHRHKTTHDTGQVVPLLVREVLPGDSIKINLSIFARTATMANPIMDTLYYETMGFYCPNRLVWSNFVKQQGEQDNPGDSISYTTPYIESPVGGFPVLSIYDQMGIPPVGQIDGASKVRINALPLRMHALIYKTWFRDENVDPSPTIPLGNGPDLWSDYTTFNRRKRKDYFTSMLTAPQKGNTVTMPLVGQAPVQGIAAQSAAIIQAGPKTAYETQGVANYGNYIQVGNPLVPNTAGTAIVMEMDNTTNFPMVYADLTGVSAIDMNTFRLAIMTQSYLEKQARGGTRYTEKLQNIWSVRPEDYRLQRPEFIGGGRTTIDTHAVAQTSETTDDSPLANLGATSTVTGSHYFTYHAKEHGFIIIYGNVRAELTYQQGIHPQWNRWTDLDYYQPPFALLGEQGVKTRVLYATGTPDDDIIAGYQPAWEDYRTNWSTTAGLFRTTSANSIKNWHLAQQFTSRPSANSAFFTEDIPMGRVLSAADLAAGLQILLDSMWDMDITRAMPMFSIPATLGRF